MLTHRTSDRLFTRSHYRYESKRGLGVLPLGRGRGNGLSPGALRWLARWPRRGALTLKSKVSPSQHAGHSPFMSATA